MGMDVNQKRQILKEYLGVFFVPLTKIEKEKIDKNVGPLRTLYLHGSNLALKKITACLLLSKGRRLEYRYLTTSELLSRWLGKVSLLDSEDNNTFHIDLDTEILIIHNIKYQPPNKALELLVSQQVAERSNRGLITILIDEGDLKMVRGAIEEYGNDVIGITANEVIGLRESCSVEFDDPVL